jgi:hypothetical protein
MGTSAAEPPGLGRESEDRLHHRQGHQLGVAELRRYACRRAPRRELRRTLQQVIGLHEQRGCQGIQIGVHRASRSDVRWRDARARITLTGPGALGRQRLRPRGSRQEGAGLRVRPGRRWILFSPARATSARGPASHSGSPGENIPPPGLCGRSPGCGQCVSRCTTRARTPRPRVSLSARIARPGRQVPGRPGRSVTGRPARSSRGAGR